ncbi:hypothetical protein F4821DRAFT_281255 [Hypoxylon rubiginosum]|uniref:Uncharacterized protein n=1 Tax=Hypoxylon rubiginosum TaxID=110542 RepID=A0ACC0DGA8_9PEZI|nr:hypothetical protein F4821DRAFT_281255 [Hypoxylon rubiginosum]
MAHETLKSGSGLLVVHAALCRMGTMSFAEAYRALGYRVHHGVDNPTKDPWVRIEEAAEATWPFIPGAKLREPFTRSDWDDLWGSHYDIITDLASPFALQLIEAYPEAKVVIVQRDFDSWWPSFEDELIHPTFSLFSEVVLFVAWYVMGVRAGQAMRKVHFGFFNARNRKEIEEHARDAYDRYYERLRAVVPPEKRLEFKLEDGWKPLCEFLGKDIPQIPFPHLNTRKEHMDGHSGRVREMFVNAAVKVAPWGLALGGIAAAVWFARD